MSAQALERVVFFGSPPFASRCFQHLCGTRFRPILLVTQPEKVQGRGKRVQKSPLAEIAEQEGIERRVCADAAAPEFLAELLALAPDVIAVVSFGQILRRSLLDLPKRGVLNVHASLLPRWRGASPIAAAIRAGDESTGLSVQRVVPKLDAGPVCARLELRIPERATAGELLSLLAEHAGPLLERALLDLHEGRAQFEEQDPAQVTLAPKIAKDEGYIPWEASAQEIDRHVRSVTPWPGATTLLPIREKQELVRVLSGGPGTATSAAEPGTIVAADEGGISIACGGPQVYRIDVLQSASGKPLPAAAFLRGRPVLVGACAQSPAPS